MIDEANFDCCLEKISANEIKDLFECTLKNDNSLDNRIHQFQMLFCIDLELQIVFNWKEWEEGRKLLQLQQFEGLSPLTICKILTAIIRSNRFCDGVLHSHFENGNISLLVKELLIFKSNFRSKGLNFIYLLVFGFLF